MWLILVFVFFAVYVNPVVDAAIGAATKAGFAPAFQAIIIDDTADKKSTVVARVVLTVGLGDFYKPPHVSESLGFDAVKQVTFSWRQTNRINFHLLERQSGEWPTGNEYFSVEFGYRGIRPAGIYTDEQDRQDLFLRSSNTSQCDARPMSCYEVLPRQFDACFGRVGSLQAGASGSGGPFSGNPVVFQGLPNKEDSRRAQWELAERGEEHEHGPKRHVLLGLQIVVLALGVIGGFGMTMQGFQRASDAVDAMLEGRRFGRHRALFWFSWALSGALLFAGSITYGLSICGACR